MFLIISEIKKNATLGGRNELRNLRQPLNFWRAVGNVVETKITTDLQQYNYLCDSKKWSTIKHPNSGHP